MVSHYPHCSIGEDFFLLCAAEQQQGFAEDVARDLMWQLLPFAFRAAEHLASCPGRHAPCIHIRDIFLMAKATRDSAGKLWLRPGFLDDKPPIRVELDWNATIRSDAATDGAVMDVIHHGAVVVPEFAYSLSQEEMVRHPCRDVPARSLMPK